MREDDTIKSRDTDMMARSEMLGQEDIISYNQDDGYGIVVRVGDELF